VREHIGGVAVDSAYRFHSAATQQDSVYRRVISDFLLSQTLVYRLCCGIHIAVE